MAEAFDDRSRTISVSHEVREMMRQLVNKGLFNEQRDVWTLGCALGIATGEEIPFSDGVTFSRLDGLDENSEFQVIMLNEYPDLSPADRRKKMLNHVEWGVREIYRKEQISSLDFSTIGK